MDPISITCAVITLATALKDLIEVGIKLKQSCAKVGNNRKKLEQLCDQIVSDLQRLEQLYKRNQVILDSLPELNLAGLELYKEGIDILQKCDKHLGDKPKKGLKNIGSSFKAWWKADEVEAEIAAFKEHVSNCHTRFLTFTAARIEVKAQQIHESTTRIDITTEQTHAEVVEVRQISQQTHDRSTQIDLTTRRIEQRLLLLSTPQMTELKRIETLVSEKSTGTPDVVPQRPVQRTVPRRSGTLVAREYLCLQVDTIDQMLSEMEIDRVHSAIDSIPFSQSIHFYSFHQSAVSRYRNVVQHTLDLLRALDEHPNDIERPALSLFTLSCHLSYLGMKEESEMLSKWCVELLRKLEAIRPEVYRLYLAKALHNFAIDLENADLEKAMSIVLEGVALLRSLGGEGSSPEIRNQLAVSLVTYSSILRKSGNMEEAHSVALEAVNISEGDLRMMIKGRTSLDALDYGSKDDIMLYSSTLPDDDETGNATTPRTSDGTITGKDLLLYTYNWTLRVLSWAQHGLGHLQQSKDSNTKCCKVLRYLAAIYTDTNIELELAQCLHFSAADGYRDFMSEEETMQLYDEAVSIHRRAYHLDGKNFTTLLIDSLFRRACRLSMSGNHDEAYRSWLEIIRLGQSTKGSQLQVAHAHFNAASALIRLGRVAEALIFRSDSVQKYRLILQTRNENEALANLALSGDYLLSRRYDEARKTAEMAVTQYRELVFQDPTAHSQSLTTSLYTLGNILNMKDDYDVAVDAVEEVVNLVDGLIPQNPNLLEDYLECLDTMLATACGIADIDAADSLGREALRRLRQFCRDYPSLNHVVLSVSMNRHGFLLANMTRVDEGLDWWREACRYYEEHPNTHGSLEVQGKLFAFLNIGLLLRDLGRLREARSAIRSAISVGEEFAGNDLKVASYTAAALAMEAQVVEAQGDRAPALALSTDALSFCRSWPSMEPLALASCLVQQSSALTVDQQHHNALIVAQEAANLFLQIPFKVPTKFDADWMVKHSESLGAVAWGIADSPAPHGDLVKALKYAKEGLDEAKKLKEVDPARLCSGISERACGDALYTLGCISLFSGDGNTALQVLSDAKSLWSRRTQSGTRKFEIRKLALTLRALGNCHCIVGNHDEGRQVQSELARLVVGLKVAYPLIHSFVSAGLKQEQLRPAWASLITITYPGALECGHQTKYELL